MKYLDERIELFVSSYTISDSRTYTYGILADNEIVYYGNVFLENGNTNKWFDITNIVSSFAYMNPAIGGDSTSLKKDFKVRLYYNSANPAVYSDSGTETVYLTYRYPHNLNRLKPDTNAQIYNNLQAGLLPVYPNTISLELSIPLLFTVNDSDIDSKIKYISYKKGNYSKTYTTDFENGLNNISFDLDDFIDDESDNIVRDEMINGQTVSVSGQYRNQVDLSGNAFRYYRIGDPTFSFGYIDEDDNFYELKQDTPPYEGIRYYAIETKDSPKIKRFQFRLHGDTIVNLSDVHIKGNCIIYFNIECTDLEEDEFTVEDIRYWTVAPAEEGITFKILDKNYPGNPKVLKLTDLCDCLNGYYLMWQDRLGGIQSQHFTGNHKYSEDFENNTISNYRGEKRKIGVGVTSKFEINSGWINEDKYPIYESIFVSPYLKLYDVKEDILYNVVLTDSNYEEKTFHNQGRQLFNLKLNLEKSTKQNIKY